METKAHKNFVKGIAVTGALLFAGAVQAAGFAIIEQSVKGLGNAYAGGSAIAEDASTIFFNPAGLTRLQGQQLLWGAISSPLSPISRTKARPTPSVDNPLAVLKAAGA